MGIISTIRRVLPSLKRKTYSVSGIPELRFGRVGWEEFRDRVVSPYQQNAWVQAGVSAKCQSIAGVPFRVYTGIRGTKQKTPLPETDPWVVLFQRPSPLYPTWPELVFAVMMHRDLNGEAPFIALGGDGTWVPGTTPAELYVANPACMSEEVDTLTQMILRWRFSEKGRYQILPPEQVGNFKRRHPWNQHRGLSPLEATKWGMDFNLSAQNFNSAFMRNGAIPGGIVKTDGVNDWTREQHETNRAKWDDRFQGTDKAGRIAFMDKDADFVTLPTDNRKMQAREHLEWGRDEIKAVLHVTDWELGSVQDFSYASAQQAQRTFWQGLRSEGTALEDFFWSWLFLPYSRRVGMNVWGEFDFSGVAALRYEFTERIASVTALSPHYGINTINERLDLGMPAVPWGNEPAGAAMPLDEEPTVSEGGPPVVAAKSKAFHVGMKAWQDTAEKVMVRAARDYFRGLRALALGNLRGKKSVAVAALLGDPGQWEAVAEASFAPSIQRIIAQMKRALKRQGFSVFPPDKELAKIARSRMAQLVKVSKRDRVRLGTRLRTFLNEREDGVSVEEMAKEIDDHFKTQNSGRAMTIARTEAAMVGGQIRHETFKAAGVEKVQWSATVDEFTRESHRRVDGEVIEMGQKYSNGLRYPSEPGAPAAEVINCRCTEVPA